MVLVWQLANFSITCQHEILIEYTKFPEWIRSVQIYFGLFRKQTFEYIYYISRLEQLKEELDKS